MKDSIVAMVPAKIGSTRLAMKNLALVGGKPLWFERTVYRGDAYEFQNRLGGIQPARFAQGRFLESGEVTP